MTWKKRIFGPGPERVSNRFLCDLAEQVRSDLECLRRRLPGVVSGCEPDFGTPGRVVISPGALVSDGCFVDLLDESPTGLGRRTLHVSGVATGEPVWFYVDGDGQLAFTSGSPPAGTGWPDHADEPTVAESSYCVLGGAVVGAAGWDQPRDLRRFVVVKPSDAPLVVGDPRTGADFETIQQALDYLEACDLTGRKTARHVVVTESFEVESPIHVRMPGVIIEARPGGDPDPDEPVVGDTRDPIVLSWSYTPVIESGADPIDAAGRGRALFDLHAAADVSILGFHMRRDGGPAVAAIWDPGDRFRLERCRVLAGESPSSADVTGTGYIAYAVGVPGHNILRRIQLVDNTFGTEKRPMEVDPDIKQKSGGAVFFAGVWSGTLEALVRVQPSLGCLADSVISRNSIAARPMQTGEGVVDEEVAFPVVDCGLNDDEAVDNRVEDNRISGGTASVRIGRRGKVRGNNIDDAGMYGVWVASSEAPAMTAGKVVNGAVEISGNSLRMARLRILEGDDGILAAEAAAKGTWWRSAIRLEMARCEIAGNVIDLNEQISCGVSEGRIRDLELEGGQMEEPPIVADTEQAFGTVTVSIANIGGGLTILPTDYFVAQDDSGLVYAPLAECRIAESSTQTTLKVLVQAENTGKGYFQYPGARLQLQSGQLNISSIRVDAPGIAGIAYAGAQTRTVGATEHAEGVVMVSGEPNFPVQIGPMNSFEVTTNYQGEPVHAVYHPVQNYEITFVSENKPVPIVVRARDAGGRGRLPPGKVFESYPSGLTGAACGGWGISGSQPLPFGQLPGERARGRVVLTEKTAGAGFRVSRDDTVTRHAGFDVSSQLRVVTYKPTRSRFLPPDPDLLVDPNAKPRAMEVEFKAEGPASTLGQMGAWVPFDESVFADDNIEDATDSKPPATGEAGITGVFDAFYQVRLGGHLVKGNEISFGPLQGKPVYAASSSGSSVAESLPPVTGFGVLLLSSGNRISGNRIVRASCGVFVIDGSAVSDNVIMVSWLGICAWRGCVVRGNEVGWFRHYLPNIEVEPPAVPKNPFFPRFPVLAGIFASLQCVVEGNKVLGLPYTADLSGLVEPPGGDIASSDGTASSPFLTALGGLVEATGASLAESIKPAAVVEARSDSTEPSDGTEAVTAPLLMRGVSVSMDPDDARSRLLALFGLPQLRDLVVPVLSGSTSGSETAMATMAAAEQEEPGFQDLVNLIWPALFLFNLPLVMFLNFFIGGGGGIEAALRYAAAALANQPEPTETPWWWLFVNWGGNAVSDNELDVHCIVAKYKPAEIVSIDVQTNVGIISSSGLVGSPPQEITIDDLIDTGLGFNQIAANVLRGGVAGYATLSPDVFQANRIEEAMIVGMLMAGPGGTVEKCEVSGSGGVKYQLTDFIKAELFVAVLTAEWARGLGISDSVLRGMLPAVGFVNSNRARIMDCEIVNESSIGGPGLEWSGNWGSCVGCRFRCNGMVEMPDESNYPAVLPVFWPAIRFAGTVVVKPTDYLPQTQGNLVAGAHLAWCCPWDGNDEVGEYVEDQQGKSPIWCYGRNPMPMPPQQELAGEAMPPPFDGTPFLQTRWTNRVHWESCWYWSIEDFIQYFLEHYRPRG